MATLRILILLLVAATVWPATARELRSSDAFPAGHPTVRAVAFMGDLLRERTSGRLTISSLGSDALDSESYTVAQLRNGTLDMARVNLNVLNSLVRGSVLPTLPFLFKSTEHMRRTLDGPVGADILAALQHHGLVGLCFYDGGKRSFYSRSHPIRSVADLKGLKVRVQRSDSWAILLRALGAEPVMMPIGQVRAAFEAGAIDAADGDWASYVAGGHQDVAPFYSLTEHSQPPSVLVFSLRVWRTLSAADQKLLREAARESVGHMRDLVDDYEATSRQHAEAAGIQIDENVDRQSFTDAMVPLYPIVIEESRLQDAVTRIQAEH